MLHQEKRIAIESQKCYSLVTTQKSNKKALNCYEQCNTGYEVSSIPFEIFAEIRSKKFYQYTAIDEFSRYRCLEAFAEKSTYSSTQFLIHMLDHFQKLGFSVKCVQTDNCFEFTKRFGGSAPDNLSLF